MRVILFVAVCLCLINCRKEDVPKGTAGPGGSSTLKITPRHHNTDIYSSTVYIKYNAQDAPSSFDDSAICVQENGEPVATFTQLKQGQYYLLAKGWDATISEDVIGGLPFTISADSTYVISLPVTEEH
ncbi:MAG: hypothetical protein EOP49_15580 [Sphingobacteriales bacterium]|nr:MAG: hypothetical protein EOP49_15580 [Sphingobacteriales bacterium]